MKKFIESISIENYRGFKEIQTIHLSDSGNMTFLIGQNNAGKTLIAKVLAIINRIQTNQTNIPNCEFDRINITDHEFHNLTTQNPITFKIVLHKDSINDLLPWMTKDFPHHNVASIISELNDLTLNIRITKFQKVFKVYSFISNLMDDSFIFFDNNMYDINRKFNAKYGTNNDLVKGITKKIIELINNSFLIFSPIRSFYENDTALFNSGSELLHFLNNNDQESEKKILKNRVHNYLSKLNLDPPFHVDASRNRQLNFTFKDSLQLSSHDVGTGYTMVYILLMEIFRNEKKVIVIDEVESHLHPGLIRELVKIFREIATNQQFVIATHSPTVMESATENDHLYHFQKVNERCLIKKFYKGADSNKSLRIVGNDIGIIPGDAFLSNCVIWVEGVSEILWLRAWMKNYLPIYLKEEEKTAHILEGLHYSILMTGGSLISNIYFDEENKALYDIEEDFGLKVLRINPFAFVIIDSDNSAKDSAKFKRCIRIAQELNEQNIISTFISNTITEITPDNIHNVPNLWLLRGRELENYCHPEILKNFYKYKADRPNSKITGNENVKDWNVFSSTDGVGKILEKKGLHGVKKDKGETIIHKMDLASYVFRNFTELHFEESPSHIPHPDPNMLNDLKNNLNKIFNYIFLVNNLD